MKLKEESKYEPRHRKLALPLSLKGAQTFTIRVRWLRIQKQKDLKTPSDETHSGIELFFFCSQSSVLKLPAEQDEIIVSLLTLWQRKSEMGLKKPHGPPGLWQVKKQPPCGPS